MMGARWHKVRADVTANRSRSVLVILSLAVGTMAVGAMQVAGDTVDSSFRASFLAGNPPSAMLWTSPISADIVDEIVAHPAVDQAEARRLAPARATTSDAMSVNVELVAMADFGDNQVSLIDPREGDWPPGAGEIVVEQASLSELRAEIGELVSFTAAGRPPVELRVVGTAFDVWEMAPTLGGAVRGYITLADMETLTGSGHLDTLYLRGAVDPLDRQQALTMTALVRDEVLTPGGVAIELSEIREPGEHRGDRALTFIVTIMQLLAILALVIAVVLVVNTISAVLAQQRRQVGVMKAVGATSGQLIAQYLGYVMVLAMAALIVAVPLSMLVGRFLAGFLAGLANFELDPLGVPWRSLAVQVAVAVLLPVVAVWVVVRRAARFTVRETLVDRGITSSARPGRFALPLGRPTRLAYRNASRNRPRLALTVLTIALCGGVVIGVFSTQIAMGRLTDQMAGYWDYDVELALSGPTESAAAAAVLGEDPDVSIVEGWYRGQAFRIRPDGTENENISLVGVVADSASIDPTVTEGRWLRPDDDHAIVVNSHFADEEADVGVGDDVVLDIEGQRRSWTIVGVSTTTLVGPVAYVSSEQLAEHVGRPGEANLLAVQLRDGADPDAAAGRLDALARAAGVPVAQVQTNAEVGAATEELIGLFTGLLLLVSAVLAIVAIIGVAGTMTLSVVEQTREVGVLRTLGASTWAVRRLLLLQGLAIAVAGAIAGILVSLPVAWALRSALESSLIDAPIPAGFSWFGVLIWIGVAFVIGALGSTRPARVASKLTIRETLAYE